MEFDFFIKELKEKIASYLSPFKQTFSNNFFSYEMSDYFLVNDVYQIEVMGKYGNNINNTTPFILLRFQICLEFQEVHLSNIFLPNFMIYKGIGKTLIQNIFDIAKKHNYYLFIIDMVPSFYERMIKRGAVPFSDDVVRITDQTRLSN